MASNYQRLSAKLPVDLHARLKKATKARGMSLTGLVKVLLTEWLDRVEEEEDAQNKRTL